MQSYPCESIASLLTEIQWRFVELQVALHCYWNATRTNPHKDCVGKDTVFLPTPWRYIYSSTVPLMLNLGNGGEWLTLRPNRFGQGTNPDVHLIGNWFGPRALLDILEKRIAYCPYRSVVFTDFAIICSRTVGCPKMSHVFRLSEWNYTCFSQVPLVGYIACLPELPCYDHKQYMIKQ